ncbi:MAG: carboxypeptidase-like regulatory domain-containing protein [Bacteroidales bacterium]
MRKLLPFIILMSWSMTHTQGQQVQGIVLDRETGAAVAFADIYIEGTLTGAMSDSTGSFSLNAAGFPNRSMTISALGYEITYYLDQFTFDRNSGTTSFIGSIFFRKDLAEGFERSQYERHRRNAFRGSYLHFFRALWKNELDQTPFTVRDSTDQELKGIQIVSTDAQGRKYLLHDGPLDLSYFTSWSRLHFTRDSVPFDRSGYSDPQAISWEGSLGKLRVGDWLPSDYLPE